MGPFPRQNLKELFKMVDDRDNFIDLLLKMFAYLPERRITAKQAMSHAFFNGIRRFHHHQDDDDYHEESATKN